MPLRRRISSDKYEAEKDKAADNACIIATRQSLQHTEEEVKRTVSDI